MTTVATQALSLSTLESPPGVPAPANIALLHLEDNAADALLIQEYLHDVLPTVAFDTAPRLADVTQERVEAADCVLLDLSLPDASGLEGLTQLREHSEHVPIIVLTGFYDMQLGLEAVRDGADDYLVKNHVDGYTLQRAIQYAIERRRLMLQLTQSAAEALVATASSITATSAARFMAEQMKNGDADRPARAETRAAPGTHEVSVRVDRESHEFVLECMSCSWQSDRGPDDVHSWTARALEAKLLRHVAYKYGSGAAARPTGTRSPVIEAPTDPPISRRTALRPRRWLT